DHRPLAPWARPRHPESQLRPGDRSPGFSVRRTRRRADNGRVLDLLHRYETYYDRQFIRALNALLKLRAAGERGPDDAAFAPAPDRVSSSAESNFPSEPKPKIESDPPQRKEPQSTPSERREIEEPGVGHNLWPLNPAPEGGDLARHLQRPTDHGPSLRT